MAEKRKDSKKRILKQGEYERPNGTYEYRWRDKQGKRQVVYAKTLDELREEELKVASNILHGKKPIDKELSVNDLFDRWKQLKRGLKDNTFQNYIYLYEQYVRNGFGEIKVYLLKKTDVRAFYNELHDERHIKVNTIDGVHTVLHQVLDLAVDDEYLYSNPADNALKEVKKAHNADTEKRRALTVLQQKIFENYLASAPEAKRWQPVFITMLYTGMRVGEVTGLQWDDVDFDNGFISVNHTLVYYAYGERKINRNCGFRINTTKTAAGYREIPLLPIVREMLEQEREFQQTFNVKCEVELDGYDSFIFVNRFGHLQHQGTLNKALKRIIRDCNYIQLDKGEETLPPFSCHNLRHTFATRLCEAGVNLKATQEILGHKDVTVTMDVYTEATRELKKREAIALDEYLKSIT